MIEWRKVPGFSRFSVSSDGQVRRDVRIYRKPPGLLAQSLSSGYPCVAMVDDLGDYCRRMVHTLVAAAFIGPRPPGAVVRHLDGVRSNCAVSNLAYGSHRDNAADAIGHGTPVRGARQHKAVLDERLVRALKLRYLDGRESVNAIARDMGIHKDTAHDVIKGRTWQHVEPAGDLRRAASGPVGASFDKRRGKWRAYRHVEGRQVWKGYHATLEAAIAAAA